MNSWKRLWYGMFMVVIVSFNIYPLAYGAPQVPCWFIFGDSLVDNGNNNGLNTTAKVNHSPYGIDFPGGPTGRFSNGRNIADIIAENLGFESSIPPFATVRDQDILKGVNYGSGGSGIRKETGQANGDRIHLEAQLQNHQTIISKITASLGKNQSSADYLNKCLYSVYMGSNDYINNYFMPEKYHTSNQYSPSQYAAVLIQQYHENIKALYTYGARKTVMFGLSPIGCIPFEWKKFNLLLPCVTRVNKAVSLFNDKLKALVDELNKQLPGAKFIYVNMYRISLDMGLRPGFKDRHSSCCKISPSIGQCLSEELACDNRNEFVYFDAFHPTEAANVVLGTRAYANQTSYDSYPYDIRTLAQLQ